MSVQLTAPATIAHITKRDGTIVDYHQRKITKAVEKAMVATGVGGGEAAHQIARKVEAILVNRQMKHFAAGRRDEYLPNVEEIQDVVEEVLMTSDFTSVAKAYILYREQKSEERRRNLFRKRTNLKPLEYPELYEYVDAIRHSYWVHTEFNYTSDVHDFRVNVTDAERQVIERAMLAIAQIEVSVKTFWGDIFKRLPKPEIGAVGYTFAESEVRHHDAYSHLLEMLGLNSGFEEVVNVPVIRDRIRYLTMHTTLIHTGENRDFTKSMILFSLFIEHVSLFSQFLIIMSFNKHRNLFKGISNAIEATSKEEQIHGLFGIELVNILRVEQPNWFDAEMEQEITQACRLAYESESRVLDWIYEHGDLDFLPKAVVKEFVKNRLNNSMQSVGFERPFEVDGQLVTQTDWFDDEVIGTKHGDFFVKRSTNYNKRSKSITGEDLF